MTKNLLILLAIFLPKKILSQTIANPYTSTGGSLKFTPVHLLKQFVHHLFDLSIGMVDMTIPIYHIQFENQTLPINLMLMCHGLNPKRINTEYWAKNGR